MADEDVTVQAIRVLFESPTEMCPLRGWLDILLRDYIDASTIHVKAIITSLRNSSELCGML